jgi:hypothetical protein
MVRCRRGCTEKRSYTIRSAEVTEVRDRRWIAATPREVWKVVSALERHPEWCPWTRAVRRADDGDRRPPGLGVAYELHGGVLAPIAQRSRWRIVEFDPPRRQVHRAEDVRLATAFDRIFELRSDGADGTWLTLGVRYRPALGWIGHAVDRVALRALQARRLPVALDAIETLVVSGPRLVG